MTTLSQSFEVGGETVHAVVLRQASKVRWNAFLWGSGLRFGNSFARREAAEKWLARLIHRRFPSVRLSQTTGQSPRPPRRRRPRILRDPAYYPHGSLSR